MITWLDESWVERVSVDSSDTDCHTLARLDDLAP